MHRLLTAAAAIALCSLMTAQPVLAAPAGGSNIVNAVSATYADAASHRYQSSSNAVVATIASLSLIVVSPKEAAANAASDSSAIGSTATRVFTITNTSNITDAYQIDKLSAGSLGIVSAAWITPSGSTPTAVNGAVSPSIAPGSSIAVQVVVSTNALAIGQSVAVQVEAHTTVTGTQTGLASDTGEQWIVGTTGPKLTGPSGGNALVSKTVNQVELVQSQPGNDVVFAITAKNSGGAAATNVKISDPVPAGLNVDLSSALIDGAPAGSQAALSGSTITFSVPSLAGGATLNVSFHAMLPPGQTLGESFVNVASISADGVPAQSTTPADVFAGSANIVFDGYAGGSHPIGNATVSLLDAAGKPVDLTSLVPSARMRTASVTGLTNPMVTGPDGSYGFALPPSAIPAQGARYYLTIAAPGYTNRRIAIDLKPTVANNFYDVTQTSDDGEPLAVAGGYTLTKTNVNIRDVFGLFGNLPLFIQSTISVTKTGDKQAASAGDRVIFTIAFQNQTSMRLSGTTVVDTMPAGLAYLTGTARLDGDALEPQVDGRTLTWTLPALAAAESHTITYASAIFGGTPPGTNLVNQVSVAATAPVGNVRTSGSSTATVTVLGGPFSMRRIVTGRVYFDDAKTGWFAKNDRPAPGVRVYLEDGSFATTDLNGEFSFPSVRPGMHVVRVDPLTLPKSAKRASDAPMNSPQSLQRLLHGVLDDGTMEDVEFALEPQS